MDLMAIFIMENTVCRIDKWNATILKNNIWKKMDVKEDQKELQVKLTYEIDNR